MIVRSIQIRFLVDTAENGHVKVAPFTEVEAVRSEIRTEPGRATRPEARQSLHMRPPASGRAGGRASLRAQAAADTPSSVLSGACFAGRFRVAGLGQKFRRAPGRRFGFSGRRAHTLA